MNLILLFFVAWAVFLTLFIVVIVWRGRNRLRDKSDEED